MRIPRATLAVPVALLLVAGLASAGDPKTPLGKWMKPNVATPMAGQDFETLQKSLELVASKPPMPGDYGNWATIARQGSAAAAKGDVAGLKASCKSCHDQYKQSYIRDFPDRAFP